MQQRRRGYNLRPPPWSEATQRATVDRRYAAAAAEHAERARAQGGGDGGEDGEGCFPPPAESLRPIPNLTWPSDHIALVADFEWHLDSSASEEAALAAPAAKRHRSDPGPTVTVPSEAPVLPVPASRAQMSWGETSLAKALP